MYQLRVKSCFGWVQRSRETEHGYWQDKQYFPQEFAIRRKIHAVGSGKEVEARVILFVKSFIGKEYSLMIEDKPI